MEMFEATQVRFDETALRVKVIVKWVFLDTRWISGRDRVALVLDELRSWPA